jgi:hypothetical protein
LKIFNCPAKVAVETEDSGREFGCGLQVIDASH